MPSSLAYIGNANTTLTLEFGWVHSSVSFPMASHTILYILRFLCPFRALRTLLTSRPLLPTALLFANNYPPHNQVNDVRDTLGTVLASLNISHVGHGFYSFRRFGAMFAFDNIPLQNIIAHRLWRSFAVWTYL